MKKPVILNTTIHTAMLEVPPCTTVMLEIPLDMPIGPIGSKLVFGRSEHRVSYTVLNAPSEPNINGNRFVVVVSDGFVAPPDKEINPKLETKGVVENTFTGLLLAIEKAYAKWDYTPDLSRVLRMAEGYTDCLYLWRDYLFTPDEINGHERALYDLLKGLSRIDAIKTKDLWRFRENLLERLNKPGGQTL